MKKIFKLITFYFLLLTLINNSVLADNKISKVEWLSTNLENKNLTNFTDWSKVFSSKDDLYLQKLVLQLRSFQDMEL